MPRAQGSTNKVTLYGRTEEPKKCRRCDSPHSRVVRKNDNPKPGSDYRKKAHQIITRRTRICKDCGNKWGTTELLKREEYPELFV